MFQHVNNFLHRIGLHLSPHNAVSGKDIELPKDVTLDHTMHMTCEFDINIPGHLPRSSSSTFVATRKLLVEEQKQTCWVCGASEDLQAHHYRLEWSLSNCIDWDKFKLDHPEFKDWDKLDKNNPDTFHYVVDAPENMLILCQKHHTGRGTGIHSLPYPIFQVQRYVKDGFTFINPINSKDLNQNVPDLDDLS